jgi:hypothetical protein
MLCNGQGFRSFWKSGDNNRQVQPTNACTPNVRFEMDKVVQEPATAVNTSDEELLTARVELNALSVKLQKVVEKIALVEASINTI